MCVSRYRDCIERISWTQREPFLGVCVCVCVCLSRSVSLTHSLLFFFLLLSRCTFPALSSPVPSLTPLCVCVFACFFVFSLFFFLCVLFLSCSFPVSRSLCLTMCVCVFEYSHTPCRLSPSMSASWLSPADSVFSAASPQRQVSCAVSCGLGKGVFFTHTYMHTHTHTHTHTQLDVAHGLEWSKTQRQVQAQASLIEELQFELQLLRAEKNAGLCGRGNFFFFFVLFCHHTLVVCETHDPLCGWMYVCFVCVTLSCVALSGVCPCLSTGIFFFYWVVILCFPSQESLHLWKLHFFALC